MKTTRAIYVPGSGAEKTEQFFDSVFAESQSGTRPEAVKAALDSVKNQSGVKLPKYAEQIAEKFGDEVLTVALDSVALGMEIYKREHGVLPTADLMDAALQQGFAAGHSLSELVKGNVTDKRVLDAVGSTEHHDQLSAQPNRVLVAVTSALAEGIPFVTYLPTDIGSNEARLGIVSHSSGSDFGGYAKNASLDGINIGENFLSAERSIRASSNGGGGTALTGQFTTLNGSGSGVPVLRYRSFVSVNGFPTAFASQQGSAAQDTFSGSINIGGTDHAIAGTITIATGAFSITATPALPANTLVDINAFVDFEVNPALTPEIMTKVDVFQLYANPWRGKAKQTIDSRTQYSNEIGMNLLSESVMAMRAQFANERHYGVLKVAMALAKFATGGIATFDFDKATQIAQKDRKQIWLNLLPLLGKISQQMAEDTMDHGITHLYVTKEIAADWRGLPTDIWEPSGVVDRPGIYRIGRLFGTYDCYYAPKVLAGTATTGQILCIGRSIQPARNTFVLGDAVPPTFLPLAFGDDFKDGTGFYGRNFTRVNPHLASAKGVALINVSNL